MASKVTLKLGLISFPVTVKTAVEAERETKLNTLCTGDDNASHAPVKINQLIKCPTCTRDGSYSNFPQRGRDNGDGTFTLVSAEDVAAANEVEEDLKNTLSLTPHPAAQVTERTVPGAKFYYLEPGKGAGDTYALLVAVLSALPNVAFCMSYAMRSAPAMYRLVTKGDVLALQMLAAPETVKPTPAVTTEYPAEMLPVAVQFAEMMVSDFDPATYSDTRRAKLVAVLDAATAIAAGEAPVASSPAAPTSQNKLMAALLAATETKPAKVTPIRRPRAKKSA